MNGPKPVCTLATNRTNQSNPRRLRRVAGGGMRSVRFPAGPAEDDAISSAGGCGAGLRSRPPTGRRDGLADRGELRGNVFMETATGTVGGGEGAVWGPPDTSIIAYASLDA